ncbi:hypothetical protein [Candidatus Schneideria nysicola]|nr:hypothetical protein [Candidatus Schneideria nysicola]
MKYKENNKILFLICLAIFVKIVHYSMMFIESSTLYAQGGIATNF